MITPKRDIERGIELAEMMVADIDKVYKKYAKAAIKATEDRAEKIRKEAYHDCKSLNELHELYGYGDITEEQFYEGKAFFETREERKRQLSFIELHRQNLKDIRDKWKGTVKELQDELDQLNGVVKDTRTYIEKLEEKERAERYANLQ